MSNDTISRAALLEEIRRRRNQATIGKTEAARWEKIVKAFPSADADPMPDVLMFIGRFSTDGHWERVQVVEAFTQGCCFWFARILEERFREEYGAYIVVDYVANHFATRIGGDRVYDITGDVTEGHTWEPWAACSDHLLRQRITDDCIMF